MLLVGFEPAIPANEGPQTHALDPSDTDRLEKETCSPRETFIIHLRWKSWYSKITLKLVLALSEIILTGVFFILSCQRLKRMRCHFIKSSLSPLPCLGYRFSNLTPIEGKWTLSSVIISVIISCSRNRQVGISTIKQHCWNSRARENISAYLCWKWTPGIWLS